MGGRQQSLWNVKYLGQGTPGMSPELFTVDIVNTDSVELNAVFNNAHTEFFFSRIINGSFVIHRSELVDEQWTSPEPLEMLPDHSGMLTAVDMTLTPDGNAMYFLGQTPAGSSLDIYVSHKVDGEWQEASKVGEPVSTDEYAEIYPVVVADGSLYFVSDRPGGVGAQDIYRAQYLGDSKFATPVSLGPVVNAELGSGDTYVAPDESFMVYGTNHPDRGMYVAFKESGQWQEPIYLSEPINSEWTDFCPYLSPDNEYFFFSRRYSDPPDSGWDGVFAGEV